jgi:N-ethylmaleimide reductase
VKLFSPVTLGAFELPNRIAMAPLTRTRADEHGVPGDLVVEYYRQRASTGLIVSEGVFTSERSKAYPGQPGIVTDEQIAAWRRVTDAVHAAGGRIVMQLMHGGRVSHEDITGGLPLLAPSAIAIQGEVHVPTGKKPYPVPSEPETDEVPLIVDEHAVAARNAIDAGFDGVEVHSANGYLLHQFLSPVSNVRTDAYGGSPEERAKLGIDVVHAIAREIGADRVGIRLSPSHGIQDVIEDDADETRATYEALVAGIAPLGLAYASILHADPRGELVQGLRATFGGPLMINTGFGVQTEREEAVELVEDGTADVVAVGRMIIANPDLVERWETGAATNEPNPATFYGPAAEGYTDYPALAS